ncbi:hypothetical protein FOA52_014865 [Chlamydomonas sp. UWO 241]|nr:hypothetical protein FOA52_014865 [Chlamydomonas sp. UWO 241]
MRAYERDICRGALWEAVGGGHVDVMRLLLDHPSTDAAAMLMCRDVEDGWTALMAAEARGDLDGMRLLLEHPCADAAAMLMHPGNYDRTPLIAAVESGRVDAMRLLLEHPRADAAAMMAVRPNRTSGLQGAAAYAAGTRFPGKIGDLVFALVSYQMR